MTEIRSYRDLVAWQQAMDLAASVYKFTRDWPREELYGLTSQSRRAATQSDTLGRVLGGLIRKLAEQT